VRVEPAGHRGDTTNGDNNNNDDNGGGGGGDAISSVGDATPSSNDISGSGRRGAAGVGQSLSSSELVGMRGMDVSTNDGRRQSIGNSVTGRRLFTATELAQESIRPNRHSDSAPRRGSNARGIVAHEPISAMLAAPNTERNGSSFDNNDPLLPSASQSLGGTRRGGAAKFQHEDQPFLSTSQRFTSSVRHVPAPGAYNPPLASQVAFTSHDGVSVPFKSRTTRASHIDAAAGAKGPGPGYYTTDLVSGEEMKQNSLSSYAFSSSNLLCVETDVHDPDVDSMFKIQHTNRFGIPIQRRKAVANTPGPGTYEPPIPTDVQHPSPIKKAVATTTSTTDEKDLNGMDDDRDHATRGGPARDRSFPINSPPIKRPQSPPHISPVGRVVPQTLVAPVPSNVRPPGPGMWHIHTNHACLLLLLLVHL
jgi:hypothetical protein